MSNKKTELSSYAYNADGEVSSPWGHIFYQKLEGVISNLSDSRFIFKVEVPEELKEEAVKEKMDWKEKIKEKRKKGEMPEKEKRFEILSRLQKETVCNDEKMLCSLLSFPTFSIKITSRVFPFLRTVHSPTGDEECNFCFKKESAEVIIQDIKSWCEEHGYPFRASSYKDNMEYTFETVGRVQLEFNMHEFLFKLWKLKECAFLLELSETDSPLKCYQKFSENIKEEKQLPYEYYNKHYKELLTEAAEQIQFSSSLSIDCKENQKCGETVAVHLKTITESPIDAAFYQLFLMYSFRGKKRIRQCQHCGKYFELSDPKKKYCGAAGCNKGNHYESKKRKRKN